MRLLRWLSLGCGAFVLLLAGALITFLVTARGSSMVEAITLVLESDELNGRELETADDVLAYLRAHPERYALAAWELGQEDAGVFHDAERAWPLASTVKIIPLVLASEEVAAGRWSLDTPTPEVDSYYLPGTDGDAHPTASTDGGTATLGGAIHGMIRYSDNAATDAILFRLGRARLASDAGLPTPHPLAGTLVLARDGFDGGSLDDAAWAAAEHLTNRTALIPLAQQLRMARELDNRGTARAFAALMARVFSDDSARTALARRELAWPMEFKSNQRDFVVLATKGGSLPGTLTSASYAETKSGRKRVLALFLHDLPFATWVSLSRSFAHQKLERRLLLDDGAIEASFR